MNKLTITSKKLVSKIVVAAMLLALCVVFMKFIPISLPVLPFARVSLGPALIIFASFYLGPLWGLVIGAGADLIGFAFDTTGYGYFPGITIMYALLGLLAHFVFKFVKTIRSKENLTVVFVVFVSFLLLLCTVNILRMDTFTLNLADVEFDIRVKIAIISTMFLLAAVMLTLILVYQRMKRNREKQQDMLPLQIALSSMILEIFVITLFGAMVKSYHFGMDFSIVVFTQLIILFINVPLNTIIITVLSRITARFID